MKSFVIRSAVLCLSVTLYGVSPASARVITHDMGGKIAKFQRLFKIAVKANEPYRIEGTCFSACTIYLGLPQVCVSPDARLGFHGAWPKYHDPKRQLKADMVMGQYLPSNLQQMFKQNWRHKSAISFKVLTGLEISQIEPKIKLCDKA